MAASSTSVGGREREANLLLLRYPRGKILPIWKRDAREYGATGVTLPPNVRVPKKIATPIKVEGKVWLASERSEHSTSPPVLLPCAEPVF